MPFYLEKTDANRVAENCNFRVGKKKKLCTMFDFLKNKLFQNTNPSFKKVVEDEFEKSIKEVFDMTSNNKDSLTLGLSVQVAIACTCKDLKETEYKATGLSKQEQDAIIDEVTKKMLHKYLENY